MKLKLANLKTIGEAYQRMADGEVFIYSHWNFFMDKKTGDILADHADGEDGAKINMLNQDVTKWQVEDTSEPDRPAIPLDR